jgi:hypothetical protein
MDDDYDEDDDIDSQLDSFSPEDIDIIAKNFKEVDE